MKRLPAFALFIAVLIGLAIVVIAGSFEIGSVWP